MRGTSAAQSWASLEDILADPIIKRMMEADAVAESDLIALMQTVAHNLGAGRSTDSIAQGIDVPHAPTEYRPGVGIMLLNHKNEVFVGRRRTMAGKAWQMPQGGIDDDEEPSAAAFRELKEEIGTDAAEILAESNDWLFYDLPTELVGKAWGGRWRGQRQKWFVMRYRGTDEDIDIATDHPEFSAWKWVSPKRLPRLIVSFKRQLYQQLLDEFQGTLRQPSGDTVPAGTDKLT
jgi:putative (di)nucleoside polyphosphate hydrolase